ncbi:hypothetical protein R50072_30510 [Simiduia litorea]|uniref:hypothetical protein n=1 Tax=Simiduia litorea TaxID=1435348 RepID=UPI0036F32443
MTRYFYLVPMLFLTVFSSNVMASGWTKSAKILALTASTQQVIIVRLALDKNSCKSKDTFYLDFSSPGYNLIYHSLLQALLHNRAVELHANGVCELNGYEGFSAIRMAN